MAVFIQGSFFYLITYFKTMGLFIRRSKKFGPFRINFSTSGIGISTGVKGGRVSVGPRGTYVHLGRYGVYYRKKN